ncbi:MAG: hypothetical protein GSR81_06010 [Desulfurococcales archaeon]|nr:hypothetical protein [Desulfurococcales archaeon]
MNPNNQCLHISMNDFAYYSWVLTQKRKACNQKLLEYVKKVYSEGVEYLKESRKVLFRNGMGTELLYIEQVEGLYMEMLRNYCLESYLSAIIISRIITEYLIDSIFSISLPKNCMKHCSNTKIGQKMEYIGKIYKNKAEKFLNTIHEVRELVNNYLHQVEKQGKIVPKREDIVNKIEEILRSPTEAETNKLLQQLTPCVPSSKEVKYLLDKINILFKSYNSIIKFILEN